MLVQWEFAGSPLGVRWESARSLLGVCWESAGSLLGIFKMVSLEGSTNELSKLTPEFAESFAWSLLGIC